MTKTQQHKELNKKFFKYVKENYPEYEIDDSEGYGRVYLVPREGNGDESLEYHRSRHTITSYPWCSEETCEIEEQLDKVLNKIRNEVGQK